MNKWIPTILNWFLPGLGYIVLKHKIPLAVMWLAGVIGLTYVEQIHIFDGQKLQALDGTAFGVLFASA